MLNLPIMIYRNIMYHKTILGIKLRNYVYDGQTMPMPTKQQSAKARDGIPLHLGKSALKTVPHITCASVAALATTYARTRIKIPPWPTIWMPSSTR